MKYYPNSHRNFKVSVLQQQGLLYGTKITQV